MRLKTAIVLALVVSLHQQARSFAESALPAKETYAQKTMDKNSRTTRSRLKSEFRQVAEDRYRVDKTGEGDYGAFRDVRWHVESEAELRDKWLRPRYTLSVMRDKSNRRIFSCRQEYDYGKKVIRIIQRGADDQITKQFTIALNSRTTDFATSVYCLRLFVEEFKTGKTVRFNLVSSEPASYNVKAELLGEDTVTIASQEVSAIKVRITPDMGYLNNILGRFLPATTLWYRKEPPHAWLKYEGLESGRRSASVITTIEEITPWF